MILTGRRLADPNDLAAVVYRNGLGANAAERAKVGCDTVLPDERGAFGDRGTATNHDLPTLVDGDGCAEEPARHNAEVRHRALFPKERVFLNAHCIGGADHLAALVDCRWNAPPAKRTEICHRALLPKKRMIPGGGCADPNHLALIVD